MLEGTSGVGTTGVRVAFSGSPMRIPVGEGWLGRICNGRGVPLDGGPPILSQRTHAIAGEPINPASRAAPSEPVLTGVSAIDGLATLARGQKLPIFSVGGLPHLDLAAQIAVQARAGEEPFAVVFAAIGITHADAAEVGAALAARGQLAHSSSSGSTRSSSRTAPGCVRSPVLRNAWPCPALTGEWISNRRTNSTWRTVRALSWRARGAGSPSTARARHTLTVAADAREQRVICHEATCGRSCPTRGPSVSAPLTTAARLSSVAMPGSGMPLHISTADGSMLRAELFAAVGEGSHPGVVVLHESFGLNDDMRRIARRFADAGYAALAPDLYSHGSRIVCLSRVMVDMLRGSLAREISDIRAARDALAARPEVDSERIAVAGFCQGGGFALIAGTQPGFSAAAVNYGEVPADSSRLDGVCPVVASYGGKDRVVGHKMAARLERHLAALGVPHDVKTYDQAGHSFFSQVDGWQGWLARVPTPMAVGYNEAAARDGWERMLSFFDEHVR